MSSITLEEIKSQPMIWKEAAALGLKAAGLPQEGERVAVVGCGTSLYMAQSYAALRESLGKGETDAFAASEYPWARRYDRVIAISRSGTTTEIATLLDGVGTAKTLITAVPDGPASSKVDHEVGLIFADESSVVQTRFATSVLVLLQAHLGIDLSSLFSEIENALTMSIPDKVLKSKQITFLGSSWAVGLSHEAALKVREAAGLWTESYPTMEYRHGPIAIAEPNRIVWGVTGFSSELIQQIEETGATIFVPSSEPLASLVVAQRAAVAIAEQAGMNPDSPRNLTRSVVIN